MNAALQDVKQLIAATGKYRLEAQNTEGANAYAFRAHHVPLDLPVFLKVLDRDPTGDVFAEPRLLVEATKTDSSESNLVRVHDAQRLGTEYILVAMEYVSGGSIHARLSGGPLPMMEAIGAAVGILHGLAQLHQSLLVHRDIKPANVLLSQRYGRIWPKITDFGSVARLANAGANVTASRHSALYVPPEGWATPSQYHVQSDLYQVGLVLFEMINGPLPYALEKYLDQWARREIRALGATSLGELDDCDACLIVNGTLARAASGKGVATFGLVQPFLPSSLKRIIKKATAPNPKDRYLTPSEMIGALQAMRLPDWQLSTPGEAYRAIGWLGWNWSVERDRKKPESWVIRRSRQGGENFRRWAEAASAKGACDLVTKAAA